MKITDTGNAYQANYEQEYKDQSNINWQTLIRTNNGSENDLLRNILIRKITYRGNSRSGALLSRTFTDQELY